MADKDEVEPTDGSDVPAADLTPDAETDDTQGATPSGAGAASSGSNPDSDEVGQEAGENGELVTAGAPARNRSKSAGGAGAVARASEGKARSTPKQKRVETAKRTGPVTFVRESVGELRKVVYPTAPQLLRYCVVVLIFVLFIIGIVSLLDLAFGAALLRIFG